MRKTRSSSVLCISTIPEAAAAASTCSTVKLAAEEVELLLKFAVLVSDPDTTGADRSTIELW